MKENKKQFIGVSAFIVDSDNKVLIVERARDDNFMPGFFELPGGKIDFGETAEEALVRECKEEVGLDVKAIKPYSTFSYTAKQDTEHAIDIQFVVRVVKDDTEVKLSDEHESFQWITVEEVENYKFSDEMRKVIKKGFENIK